jgi:hypothetical protein
LTGHTEDGGDKFLLNVGGLPINYTALYSRRQYRCEHVKSKEIIQLLPTKSYRPMSGHPPRENSRGCTVGSPTRTVHLVTHYRIENCYVPTEVNTERLLCYEPAHKEYINAFCHTILSFSKQICSSANALYVGSIPARDISGGKTVAVRY